MIDKGVCVLTDPRNLANFNAQQLKPEPHLAREHMRILNREGPLKPAYPHEKHQRTDTAIRDNRGETTHHDINPIAQIYEGGSEVPAGITHLDS